MRYRSSLRTALLLLFLGGRNGADSLAEKWTLYIVKTPKIMPYFHATAVFEVNGTSLDNAERTAGALFKSFRHRRVHYHEHDVTAGTNSPSDSRVLYFSVIAEFDIDAGNEERAVDVAEEVLEALATDDVQFIAFGLTQGEQRVQVAERPDQEERKSARPQEAREESDEEEDRRGKRRTPRGRGRRRKGEREEEPSREEADVPALAAELGESSQAKITLEAPTQEENSTTATEAIAPVSAGQPDAGAASAQLEVLEETPPLPPPRSSASMRVTVTLSFRARELGLQTNGVGALDQEEFLARAIAEARSRHPELPLDAPFTHEIVVRPWGETVLTLTWAYDVPVPSASEDA